MNKTMKVIGSIGVAAALIGAGFVGAALKQPEVITKTVIKEVPFITQKVVEVPVIKEVINNVTQEVFIEDVELLEKICDRLMFDDIIECREEVDAEDDALNLALELIKSDKDLFDFLEDEGFINDEDEARVVKLYDSFDDVEIVSSDFDNEEYVFKIKVRVEDEDADVKSKVLLTVKVEEGEASFEDVELI